MQVSADRRNHLAPNMAGPHVDSAAELVRSYLHASHRRRPIIPIRLPGKAAAAFRDGANLTPEHAVGQRTGEEFLADELNSSAAALTVS